MPDTFFRFVAHPLPVIAHVFGEPARAGPGGSVKRLFRLVFVLPRRVDWRLSGKLGRNLNQRLVDEHRHGIEV